MQSQVDQAILPVLCPMCVADHSWTAEYGGSMDQSSLNCVEDLFTFTLLVVSRGLLETLGTDEASLVKCVKLEMDKISVVVVCPR